MIVVAVPVNCAPVIVPVGVPVTDTDPEVPLKFVSVIVPDGVPVTDTLPDVPLNAAPVIVPEGVPVTDMLPCVPLKFVSVIVPDGVPVTDTDPEVPSNLVFVIDPSGVTSTSIVEDVPVNDGAVAEYEGTLDTAVTLLVYVDVNVGRVPAPHDIDKVSPSVPPTVMSKAGSVPCVALCMTDSTERFLTVAVPPPVDKDMTGAPIVPFGVYSTYDVV